MNDIVKLAEVELKKLNNAPIGEHLKTGGIRKLSTKLFCSLQDKSKENVFIISESLFEQQKIVDMFPQTSKTLKNG